MIMEGRKTIVGLVFLAIVSVGYADMTDVFVQVEPKVLQQERSILPSQFSSFSNRSFSGLGPLPVGSLAETNPHTAVNSETPPVTILDDGQSSVTLCLYTLMGVGLCGSAARMKRFSVDTIPQWYHDAGPLRIGHSQAISPDCLTTAIVCFIQCEHITQNIPFQYRLGIVHSLWRTSQFDPTILAPHAPPFRSC